MKYTLLEMVQDVMSSMDSDEVNSITDTTESLQVARIVRACYFDVVSVKLPEFTTIYQLNASTDPSKPVMMTLPSDAHSIMTLKYNKATVDHPDQDFTILTPLTNEDFFNMTHMLSLSEDNVAAMEYLNGIDAFNFLYRTDKHPDYYTIVNDHVFLFDSFDSTIDSTLQKSKTFAIGEKESKFSLTDNYVIDLDEAQHIWLLNEVKTLAFIEMKQSQHPMAERTARRHRIKAQKDKYTHNDWKLYYNTQLPDYSRRGNRPASRLIMH